MADPRFAETQRAYRENDPPVRVDQRWVAYVDGEVFRRIRILAPHPDPDTNGGRLWITKDEPAKMSRTELWLNVTPEFNLRYVFELEESNEAAT